MNDRVRAELLPVSQTRRVIFYVTFVDQQHRAIFGSPASDEIFLVRAMMRVDQFFYCGAERLVFATLLRDVNLTCFVFERDRRFEYPTYLLPTFGIQLPALSVSCW